MAKDFSLTGADGHLQTEFALPGFIASHQQQRDVSGCDQQNQHYQPHKYVDLVAVLLVVTLQPFGGIEIEQGFPLFGVNIADADFRGIEEC